MSEPKRFAVCIRNEGNEASLELRKIYEILKTPQPRTMRWFASSMRKTRTICTQLRGLSRSNCPPMSSRQFLTWSSTDLPPNSSAAADANRSASVLCLLLFPVRLAPVSGKPLGVLSSERRLHSVPRA